MEPAPAPAAELVDRARRGDRAAFAALYDATSRSVFLYAVGILGRVEDAEDVTHTAFLLAWRTLPRLREPSRFAAWLFRITRNAARDLRRRGRPHAPLPEDLASREGAEPPGLLGLLDGLAPPTRTLLLLRHGLGWDVDEIARVTATSAPTVRRHLARAVEHLRHRHEGRTADVR